MRTWAKSSALLAAAVLSFGAGTAHAGTAYADTGENVTDGSGSVLGGNQVNLPINLSLELCGTAIAVLGQAQAGCMGGASISQGTRVTGSRSQSTQSSSKSTKSSSSKTKSDESVTSLQKSTTKTKSTVAKSTAKTKSQEKRTSTTKSSRESSGVSRGSWQYWENSWGYGNIWGAGGNYTSGQGGVLSGNQVVAPITAPINVCGNAVALAGQAFAGCTGGASVITYGKGSGGRNVTSGQGGVLSGNQVIAPITAPVNVCGNAVAVLGQADAGCVGGASVTGAGAGSGGRNVTSGQGGVAAGNQVIAPITAPVNVCGNAVAVLGAASAGCVGGSQVGGQMNTSGAAAGSGGTGAAESAQLLPALPLSAPPQLLGGGAPLAPVTGLVSGGAGRSAAADQPTTGQAKTGVAKTGTSTGSAGTGSAQRSAEKSAKGQEQAVGQEQAIDTSSGLLNIVEKGDDGELRLVGIRLMSAEQPAQESGERSGSLLALVMAGLLAVPVAFLARTRSRLRAGRR